jgi:hypothetical protein
VIVRKSSASVVPFWHDTDDEFDYLVMVDAEEMETGSLVG